jgi:hypothetical protein
MQAPLRAIPDCTSWLLMQAMQAMHALHTQIAPALLELATVVQHALSAIG